MYGTLDYGILKSHERKGRLILKGGLVIDPASRLEEIRDVVIEKDQIQDVVLEASCLPEDRVIDCRGLEVWPGLIDMHLHISDLYEFDTRTAWGAVEDGVTMGLTPGAGNTFMTPALLGAEVDRGLPINLGAYIGGANVLGTMLDTEELIQLFKGELSKERKDQKLSRNWITNETAPYAVGIKEHMGHFLLPDEKIRQLFQITEEAGLVFMSHTQDIRHTERICDLADGRAVHLGHASAVGCGTHGDPVKAMKKVIDLCRQDHITGEFVTTMLRRGRGSREGLQIDRKAQEIALQAVADREIKILVSDGQNQSTMKGFGDTRDNIPCILELIQDQVLDRQSAVATMTANPAKLLAIRTGCQEWKRYGNLSPCSYANLTVVDVDDKLATYVVTNGHLTAFENRCLRGSGHAGYWVSRFGTHQEMGVGGLPLYQS